MKILVLGSKGTLGSAFCRNISKLNDHSLEVLTRDEIDFSIYSETLDAIAHIGPDLVVNCVGSVGGVKENLEHPFNLVAVNSLTSSNIARALHNLQISKYCYFAPACVYPTKIEDSVTELDLWQGSPEISSRPYASSKLMGIELVRSANFEFNYDWKIFIPTNVFGIGDWKHANSGHVISMMVQKIVNAKKDNLNYIELWGTGNAVRDFISSDSLATFVISKFDSWKEELPEISNVPGYGPITIKNLAQLLCGIIDYHGEIIFDTSKPEGSRFKVLGQAAGSMKVNHDTNLEEQLRIYVKQFELSGNIL